MQLFIGLSPPYMISRSQLRVKYEEPQEDQGLPLSLHASSFELTADVIVLVRHKHLVKYDHPILPASLLVQMLYTIEGNQLRVAFVEENGGEGAVVNDLSQGDVAFFPQGLIHYQQNLDCEPATFLAALNSEDPGVVTITTRFFELPSEAIMMG